MQQSLYPSIKLLIKKCHHFLGSRFYLLGGGVSFQWNSREKITHLILFGHPTELLKSQYFWPSDRKFKFYTFSQSHKKLLLETFPKLKENQLQALPRYTLFPLKKTVRAKAIDWTLPINLIFSGRIDEENKHLDVVIKVAHDLQMIHDIDLQLIICGPDLDSNKFRPYSQLIKSLKWKKKPLLMGDLGTNWMKKIPGRKALMNFSTSLREDYGVSIAQAQQHKWPVIVSDWGAHKEINEGMVTKIPSRLILRGKTKEIAKICLQDPQRTAKRKGKKITAPREVSYKQLMAIQQSYRVLGKKKINQILG